MFEGNSSLLSRLTQFIPFGPVIALQIIKWEYQTAFLLLTSCFFFFFFFFSCMKDYRNDHIAVVVQLLAIFRWRSDVKGERAIRLFLYMNIYDKLRCYGERAVIKSFAATVCAMVHHLVATTWPNTTNRCILLSRKMCNVHTLIERYFSTRFDSHRLWITTRVAESHL